MQDILGCHLMLTIMYTVYHTTDIPSCVFIVVTVQYINVIIFCAAHAAIAFFSEVTCSASMHTSTNEPSTMHVVVPLGPPYLECSSVCTGFSDLQVWYFSDALQQS